MQSYRFNSLVLSFSLALLMACSVKTEQAEKRQKVELITNQGTLIIELYNETPKHRDNFIKLAKDGTLDSVLFHRVIENFMIQAGDIDSKNASPTDTLGNGELGYLVDAEFVPTLFHKKGALGAARDGNVARASSSTQFYIVQGRVHSDSLLDIAETRINGWLAENYFINAPENKPLLDSMNVATEKKDWGKYSQIMDSIRTMSKTFKGFEKYTIPEAHRDVYKSIGGTPHLDQNYTVFAEVISGIEIVDTIAKSQTNSLDRPLVDIRILSVRLID